MQFSKFSLLMLILTASACSAQHKIILISAPRSLSVAFLRMMQERGDFQILHEPSQFVFNLKHSTQEVQNWFNSDAPKTYDEVKDLIMTTAQNGNVFVKEMSFAVEEWLTQDIEWISNPDIHFVFLLRDPHHIALSFYKKLEPVFDECKHQWEDLIGYRSLYNVYQAINKYAACKPYIVLTQDLYTNPRQTVEQFCAAVDIPFIAESLQWDNLEHNFDPQQWHEIKHSDITNHWHSDAIRSTGFGKPTKYAVDNAGKPTFEEIGNEEHRHIVMKAYETNVPHYYLLLAQIMKER